MKWFKHKTNASEREFLTELEDTFGLEGYARWFKILEKIGAIMGGENGCSASYPWPQWQAFLKGKRNKLETFLVHLENKQRINRKVNGNIMEIECLKILEIKDNYTTNLQVNNNDIASRYKNKEIRGKNKEYIKGGGEEKNPDLLPKNKKELIFEDRWINYAGEKDNKKKALGHWNAKIVAQKDVDNYDKALLNYYAIIAHDRINGFLDRRLKGGKTWFNNFESYIDQAPPQEKTADGIEREQQIGEQDLKAKCFSQLEFVEEELKAGEIRDYQWFYMALDKLVMECERRFGANPFKEFESLLISYQIIRDEMKLKEEV